LNGTYRFTMATDIVYGSGAARKTGDFAAERGAKKALLISDPGVRQANLLEPIQNSLRDKGVDAELFDDVAQSSSVQAVDKGAALARENGCDLIVAVGGGSAIDTAKATGVVATNGGCCSDYAGSGKVKLPSLPVFALPTTAGTSAEVTDVAVIADRARHARIGIRSPYIVPDLALVDPLLTVSMPAPVTAATGMDALTHAIESYTNTATFRPTELAALEAIALIGANLRQAVANGGNLEAREQMSLACILVGMAYRNTRLGILHAITGPFCGYYDIAHGVANAVLLPHVMKFNLIGSPEKFARIAAALGVRTGRLGTRDAALASVEAVRHLLADIGLPEDFKDLQLDRSLLPQIVAEAAKSANLAINPRKASAADLQAICEQVV